MSLPLPVNFVAGSSGAWRISSISAVTGSSLPSAEMLSVCEGDIYRQRVGDVWVLRGTTSNIRYTRKSEVEILASNQAGLGRREATCAALIPIRKTTAWWALAQDERREIFEEQSRHIQVGLEYLPAVARRLHHSRDISEPFDFLTWFEYAPEHERQFETMVNRLRQSEEWRYVEREIDIRLTRGPL